MSMVRRLKKFVDIDGNVVKRNKIEYPYSYDEFVVWKNNYIRGDQIIYSDRIIRDDYYKYNSCSMQVWGNSGHSFSARNPREIEQFICLYLNTKVKLTLIMEGCNFSSGYPYWIFGFRANV